MGPEFFQTRMGQDFYTHYVPEIAEQLTRIADSLEKLAALAEEEERHDNES